MSQLADNQRIETKAVRVRIIQDTSPATFSWYRDHVGKVFTADRQNLYEDGELVNTSYTVARTPDGGYKGHIMTRDLEEL